MRGMQRHAKWIALAVVVAMVSPFLAQGLSTLFSVEPVYVALALLAVVAVVVARMAWPREDGDGD